MLLALKCRFLYTGSKIGDRELFLGQSNSLAHNEIKMPNVIIQVSTSPLLIDMFRKHSN